MIPNTYSSTPTIANVASSKRHLVDTSMSSHSHYAARSEASAQGFDIHEHVRKGLRPASSLASAPLDGARSPLALPAQPPLHTDLQRERRRRESVASEPKSGAKIEAAAAADGESDEEAEPLVMTRFLKDVAAEEGRGAGECAASLTEFELTLNRRDSLNGALTSSSSSSSASSMDEDETISSSTNPSVPTGRQQQVKPADPSEEALVFRTFLPKGVRGSANPPLPSSSSSCLADPAAKQPGCDTNNLLSVEFRNQRNSGKRASTLELNGNCYLAIETEPSAVANKPVQQAEYRGGVGTLPRDGGYLDVQQEMLEASLNSESRGFSRANRSESRGSLFRRSRLRKGERRKSASLSRPRSGGKSSKAAAAAGMTRSPSQLFCGSDGDGDEENGTRVPLKSNDMF